jgi:uncharacterized protein
MSQENAAVIRRVYEAFAAGDVAAVLGAFSPDIVWNEAENFPYSDRNPYKGPQAIAEGIFGRIVQDWDGFTVAFEEILDAGDTVVALGRYLGTHKKTGAPLRAQHVHVWRLAQGKVVGFQQYVDTLQVARVAGAV